MPVVERLASDNRKTEKKKKTTNGTICRDISAHTLKAFQWAAVQV